MLHVDRPAYPQRMFVECYFKGGFKREALQAAMEVMLARHPLFSCVVRRRWGRWYWEPAPGWKPVVEWERGTLERTWPEARTMDLTREPGFRMVAIERCGADEKCEGTSLVWQLHHSLCDAAGFMLMMEDTFVAYARSQGQEVEFQELHPGRLRGRNRFGLSVWDKVRMVPLQLVGLLACWVLVRRKTAVLTGGERVDDSIDSPPLTMVSRHKSAEERRKIGEAARRQNAGSNDLFIRDFQCALGLWRKEQRIGGPADWLHLIVPVSLRRPADRFLPAVNVMSVAVLSRSAESTRKRKRILERTLEEMAWVKNKGFGFSFLLLLGVCRLAPGGLRRYARRSGAFGTATLSNLGQMFSRTSLRNSQRRQEVPGAVMEDMRCSAPLQPGVVVAMDVSVYAGRLAFDLTYDGRVMSAADAERLMDIFFEQLQLSVENA